MTHPESATAGRRARFESLALPHLDALYGLAVRLCHNGRDAEDLVQDSILRAYQGFSSFVAQRGEESQRCKAWLFRILTNTFINRYRRRVLEHRVAESLHREGDGGILSADALRRGRDPEGALQAARLQEDIQRALEALPEEFRVAVLLCDIEEFSYKEIAEVMDCPVGTVMSRLHRGRRMLHESLRSAEKASEKASGRAGAVIPLRRDGGK